MPVPCHQCGQPIDILYRATARPTLHFHGRCYSDFQADQGRMVDMDQQYEDQPPHPEHDTAADGPRMDVHQSPD